ncbi:cyanophycin synthetase [Clostridium fungisolvens]|uniref:Cyanophycin synthetase n=1 Tax=Clostridium fungisolvens TaxID=1604897 RepID=A0A6V8SLC5_9CLOT|nr:cyanophycin synthetase [Clostridium fungisolvens]GFP77365.1 Cyanophycin synthetase [Clostridium fungisolvens]
MKLVKEIVYDGKNVYSHKKCIRADVDLEGYCEIPSKDIPNFNDTLVKMLPELNKHRCGIDEDNGFVTRLKEGTYLAHICEHITIAIQNILGIDVAYGKAREIKDDLYYMIIQYEHKNTALGAIYLAIDLINSLIEQKTINLEERLEYLKQTMSQEMMGPSTKAICDAAQKRKLPVLKLGDGGMYQIGYGKQGRVIAAALGDSTRCIGADIACDKMLTKQLLKAQFIPVAIGEKVFNTIDLLQKADDIGYPVVLKPQFGNKGKGVILNITDQKSLLKAYKAINSDYKDIIIEKYVKGEDYRVCVVNNKVIAAAKRLPPFVIGDGSANIKDLIRNLNSDPRRGEKHEKPLTKVKMDECLISCIKKQGFNISSIPVKGERVFLRENANLSTGGISIDCTDEICEENIKLCIRVAKTIGLDICGIDICTEDISEPISGKGIIVEVNAAPGIRMHHYPTFGKERDVAGAIVDMMYEGNPKNIPVISVTGTNGKTTTTRLISHVISLMGYSVGMTTTSGVVINGEYIDTGDDTGPKSAKSVLLNKDVDVAVLETARGGIVRNGLAYDVADVGIITNITEDHLGIDNIDTMEQLAFAKALVAEAIKEEGYAVINVDDIWSIRVLDRIKDKKKILFSMNRDNQYIRENIMQGNPVVYASDGAIYVENNNKRYTVCMIKDIPITKNGNLKYNIYNSLAACSALVGINLDYAIIAKGLTTFLGDENSNPGRFNEYDINGTKVILDYGHNIDGYTCVLDALKGMPHNRLIGVIGVPGDRKDESIQKLGALSAQFLDKIYIKEDLDKRGRREGEVADILLKGALDYKSKKDIHVILDEVVALDNALSDSVPGDVIVVFFEEFERLVNYIKDKSEEVVDLIELENVVHM